MRKKAMILSSVLRKASALTLKERGGGRQAGRGVNSVREGHRIVEHGDGGGAAAATGRRVESARGCMGELVDGRGQCGGYFLISSMAAIVARWSKQ